MKKLLKLFFFILFLAFSCKNEDKISNYNQYEISDFRKELIPHLESLAKEKSLPSKDKVARKYIQENTTKDELIKLLRVNNPLLRTIAYITIVNRQEYEYFDLLVNHLDDMETFTCWMADDYATECTVSGLMIQKAHGKNGLSPIQKKYLVEKVLFEHPYLNVSDKMIHDIEPEEKYYNLIRERAQKTKKKVCQDLSACFALSKFRKDEDVELLKTIFKENIDDFCRNYIFRSIENFPHQEFYPLLEAYFERNVKPKSEEERLDSNILFFARAVASYKNENALEILNFIEQNNFPIAEGYWPPNNKEYVYKAIRIHNDDIYDDLMLKIEKEFNECELDRHRDLDVSFIAENVEWKYW
ncbi:MAG: hypothetical protein RBR78_05335 [Flavobacteriaceae bacterium]|jgi:hypothetical protein|nr:hypothetical protein [Flavobacteriaceae bacterium]